MEDSANYNIEHGERLQHVQNSLVCVVFAAPYNTSANNLLWSLHWLAIQKRVVFKIAIISHKVRLHSQPSYLLDLLVHYIPARLFRSSGKGCSWSHASRLRSPPGHFMLLPRRSGTIYHITSVLPPPQAASLNRLTFLHPSKASH